MPKKLFVAIIIICCLLRAKAQTTTAHTPRLIRNGNVIQLIVNDKTYLILVVSWEIQVHRMIEKFQKKLTDEESHFFTVGLLLHSNVGGANFNNRQQ
jgi:hypothetical protein